MPSMPDALLRGALLGPLALLWVLCLSRIVGLRSFTKMTAFDFVATVATGSLLASAATSTSWSSFAQAIMAMTSLFTCQFALAWCRQRFGGFRSLVDNRPRVLVRDGELDETALRETRVARSDVIAKLREANALQLSKVRAVVLEPTGDVSVLHGEVVDPILLDEPEGRGGA